MLNFNSIQGTSLKIAYNPNPKGIIQFVGAFVFGSFPENSYKYLFQYLYKQGYSIIIHRFPFNLFQFEHFPVAIELLTNLYKARVKIIEKLKEIYPKQLDFYVNDANYFWLGHSLGCKYILLLEILSDSDKKRRNQILELSLRSEHQYELYNAIEKLDLEREQAELLIGRILNRPYKMGSYFIRDQPSLLLAPEFNNTIQLLNLSFRPSSRFGFPNRQEMKSLIEKSTELFKLMSLISFNLDGLAYDDVDYLKDQLQLRGFLPFLHKVFFGGHFEPQGLHLEQLALCIDLILQELRKRQQQGASKTVQCEHEQCCGLEIEKTEKNSYDIILVGSGNGACGFLSKYLEQFQDSDQNDHKILVLEAGNSFFETSDITHQNNWTKSYSEGEIFQLHNAQTKDGLPIISGWANTMGGGGSINYAMIYESSSWLSTHFGQEVYYWNDIKQQLEERLDCINPSQQKTALTQHIIEAATSFQGFNPPNSHNRIPSYQDLHHCKSNQIYLFPTQFNSFGQRTHSGVSLINWASNLIELKNQHLVTKLIFNEPESGALNCKAVQVKDLNTGIIKYSFLKKNGRVILCAGAATPRLLMPYREKLNNTEIGKYVSDHIAIPIGIYLIKERLQLTPKDVYVPIFAKTIWQPEECTSGRETVCSLEFFAGNLEQLWLYLSHIYLAFALCNGLKKQVIRKPTLFRFYKQLGFIISKLNRNFNLLENINLITAIVKFNPAKEGEYSDEDNCINLGFFEKTDTEPLFAQDIQVADDVISEQLIPLIEKLGKKPHPIVRFFLRLYGLPYDASQVQKYLKRYSKNYLLSQQHMAGGCLFGKAISTGANNPHDTGKVFGASNVHVADLSASPLPRVSSQMTAYLIGFHVATQLSSTNKSSSP